MSSKKMVQQIVISSSFYLNPGSLGLALDGVGGHIHFAVLHGNRKKNCWDTELITLPYDATSFLEDFTESGLDELGFVLNRAVKKTIMTGINFVFKCVSTVQQITGLPLHLVSEEVWEDAARKFDL